MKAVIKSAEFKKEFESKFGTMYQFLVTYDDKKAVYSSKNKEQKNFVVGQEAEFTEETKTFINKRGENSTYLVIKPIQGFKKQSNFGKALQKEQSRYSGFSESYVKDLLACGLIKPELTEAEEEHNDIVIMTWKKRSFEIFEHMVELDNVLQQ